MPQLENRNLIGSRIGDQRRHTAEVSDEPMISVGARNVIGKALDIATQHQEHGGDLVGGKIRAGRLGP